MIDREKVIVSDERDSFTDKNRDRLSNLVRKTLFHQIISKITIHVDITPEGYNHRIEYGGIRGWSLEQVAQLQGQAEQVAQTHKENNPNAKGISYDSEFSYEIFDPLGLKIRLWRYLGI